MSRSDESSSPDLEPPVPDPAEEPGEHVPDQTYEAALAGLLERDRESAWQIAHYERGQRDEYTSKLRFGLAAINAASLVTILNVPSALIGIDPRAVLFASASFLVGTVLAGYSLTAHQVHLINSVRSTSGRANALDRAFALTVFPAGSKERDGIRKVIRQAHDYLVETPELSMGALRCQWWSASIWVSGAGLLAVAKAAKTFPALHLIRG